jgi:hypothetical protein
MMSKHLMKASRKVTHSLYCTPNKQQDSQIKMEGQMTFKSTLKLIFLSLTITLNLAEGGIIFRH